jgi:hypothetical protein
VTPETNRNGLRVEFEIRTFEEFMRRPKNSTNNRIHRIPHRKWRRVLTGFQDHENDAYTDKQT